MSVVVTGVGAVTPIGSTADAFYKGLLDGESGVRLLGGPAFDGLPVRLGATADIGGRIERSAARTTERVQHLALVAAREAWRQAGEPDVAPERLAVVIGTAIGGGQVVPPQSAVMRDKGARYVSPYLMPQLMANGAAATVALDLKARGGVHTSVASCASGASAIALAVDILRLNRADIVVTGGAESCVCEMALAGFAQLRALSVRHDDPPSASRPFDRARDGFVLGEGAGMLVLERAEHARGRKARHLGRIVGTGTTSDAYHVMAPDPSGVSAARCVELALRDAELSGPDIGHVNSHATATPVGDLAEARALGLVLAGHRPPVTATKSCTGHLLGASGAVEAVATILTLRDGLVPAIRNLNQPDDEIDLDLVRDSPRKIASEFALSLSIGFGGHNTALILAK